MTWNDLTLNPRVVLGYYSTPPDLDAVEVRSIRLDRDGPTLEMTVAMSSFPDRPSRRRAESDNAALAEFRFSGLLEIRVEGWTTSNVGRLSVSRTPAGIRFEFLGEGTSCVGVSEWFDVTGVRTYTERRPVDEPR